MIRRLFIQTIGCQMNVYDSEQMAKGLSDLGFTPTSRIREADMILLNTCSVREKAEQKVFSFLGRIAKLKKEKPDLILGVAGCVAQQEGKLIFQRMPHVDLVLGTHAIGRIQMHVERILKSGHRIVDIGEQRSTEDLTPFVRPDDTGEVSRFVTIMQGCDNHCTYCVVPHVRGPETSRTPEAVISEVKGLVSRGAKEITLLGQNVNSYGKKEGLPDFAGLLAGINGIPGLLRIRFTTSHPKDLSDSLIAAFRDLDKLCHHIHLPVQSGSDRILKKMNRKYTTAQYLDKVDRLRQACPDIAVTSDFIAGFPGETRQDFDRTLELIQRVEYDTVFAFAYSDRPFTPASRFHDKVRQQERKERLARLLALQGEISLAKNRDCVGTVQQILVSGLSKKQETDGPPAKDHGARQWTGRTTTNRIVNFPVSDSEGDGLKIQKGDLVSVRITRAYPHSLFGEPAG